MSENIVRIVDYKKPNLKGSVIIDGIPMVSLSSAIAANYLVSFLNLDQVAAIDSTLFPPVSMVYAGKPKCPARVYASEKLKVAVFLSEFVIPLKLSRPLARAMLDWCKTRGCGYIVTLLALPLEGVERKVMPEEVFGIGSTDEMREKLSEAGVRQMDYGVITGLSAILLNEGRLENFDVITLVTPLYSQAEEYRAAAKLLETVNKLVPRLEIDLTELFEEAKKYETMIKTLREQSRSVQPKAPELYI